MRLSKLMGIFLACIVLVNGFCLVTPAAGTYEQEAKILVARATGKFSMEIPGNTAVQASSSFPLEAGETVTIKATYSPFSASVDFGLIAPDGLFYGVNTTNGSFDETIQVEQKGHYTLSICNYSSLEISLSVFINY